MANKRVYVGAFLLFCGLMGYWTLHNTVGEFYWGVPRKHMLEGVWQMSDQSLQKLRRAGYAKTGIHDHQLVLRDDGSCQFKSYWVYLASDIEGNDYVTANGTWRITSVLFGRLGFAGERRSALELELHPNAIETTTVTFYVSREDGQLALWNYLGDPDNEESIIFCKLR